VTTTESETRFFTRRRIASIVFALGCASLLLTILPAMPQDRGVELRLPESAAVTAVELTWLSPEGDPLQGTSLRYAPGSAPSLWTLQTQLPEGDYTVEATVQRGTARASMRQFVRVKGDEPITLSLP
jgi:hypothetical protein